MPAFEYKALDARGRKTKGVLEGDSARAVRQQLRADGLNPLNVDQVASASAGKAVRRGFRQPRLSPGDLALLTRQLAVLLRSGAPLEEALSNVARQTNKASIQRVVMGVRSKVIEGYSLAAGLAEFPATFDELYRATVEAGEEAGHLEAVLERLADYTESRQEMQQKVSTAMVYPILLTLVAIGVLGGLLGYVVPQVVTVFDNLGQELPALTKNLLILSGFVQNYGLWLVGGSVLAYWLFKRSLRNESLRYRFHAFQLSVPLMRSLLRGINSARFARTLSILAGSGVAILQALEISARVVSNLPMREAVVKAAERVREGSLIHKALEQSGQFPPMTVYLIANGESSGQLEQMLERAAVQQERETDVALSTALSLFEPLLIIVMGTLVLIIVLAILMPIFELNQLVV